MSYEMSYLSVTKTVSSEKMISGILGGPEMALRNGEDDGRHAP